MLLKEIIERALSNATEVAFMATRDLRKEPSVIYLVFPNSSEYAHIYEMILSRYEDYQLGLILKRNEGKIDLTITDKDSDTVIEAKGLGYNENELRDFMRETPYEWRFGFVFGFVDSSGKMSQMRTSRFLSMEGYRLEFTS